MDQVQGNDIRWTGISTSIDEVVDMSVNTTDIGLLMPSSVPILRQQVYAIAEEINRNGLPLDKIPSERFPSANFVAIVSFTRVRVRATLKIQWAPPSPLIN